MLYATERRAPPHLLVVQLEPLEPADLVLAQLARRDSSGGKPPPHLHAGAREIGARRLPLQPFVLLGHAPLDVPHACLEPPLRHGRLLVRQRRSRRRLGDQSRAIYQGIYREYTGNVRCWNRRSAMDASSSASAARAAAWGTNRVRWYRESFGNIQNRSI
eukprot:9483017-Pyramimonas_sp.AAC.1